MISNEKLERARKQVAELKKFYTHLVIYLVVMILLFVIDYQDKGNWWVYYPAIGWGIVVVIQGASIGIFNSGWEDKKVKELMEKE
ncbi:2TM domain-containing protein [Patescibacteria group bacterium]